MCQLLPATIPTAEKEQVPKQAGEWDLATDGEQQSCFSVGLAVFLGLKNEERIPGKTLEMV